MSISYKLNFTIKLLYKDIEKYKNIEKSQKYKNMFWLFVILLRFYVFFFYVRITRAAFVKTRSEYRLFRMKKNLSNRFAWVLFFSVSGHLSTWSFLIGPRQISVTAYDTASKSRRDSHLMLLFRGTRPLILIVQFKTNQRFRIRRFIFSSIQTLPPNT